MNEANEEEQALVASTAVQPLDIPTSHQPSAIPYVRTTYDALTTNFCLTVTPLLLP